MGIWTFDPMHTQVQFAAKHLGMMTVRGHFDDVEASGHLDVEHPDRSQVTVTIKPASLTTRNEMRDNHLRNEDFFDVEKFPTVTFRSTKIEPNGPDRYAMTGDLTIKDVTRTVTLTVTRQGEFNDPRMGHRIAYAAEASLNRKEFNLNFDAVLDGKMVVSNEVKLQIEGELLEAAEEPAAALTA